MWFVKKIVIRKINRLLNTYKSDVNKVRQCLIKWTSRTRKILNCLDNALAKLDDNILDADELKATTEEIETLIRGW